MPHAFLNTALYLDWDRRGFGYPILPIAINCYRRALIHSEGRILNRLTDVPVGEDLDPPSPQPSRCFDIGRAIARAMQSQPRTGGAGHLHPRASGGWRLRYHERTFQLRKVVDQRLEIAGAEQQHG